MACQRRVVYVYDRRKGDGQPQCFNLSQCKSCLDFIKLVCEKFSIAATDKFVVCNTNREVIDEEELFNKIEDGETLYILMDAKQGLSASTKEKVQYLPHYDTLVKSGMYEYYASEGQNPLPFAFAELIDNALTATVETIGPRKIEIRLMLDENSDRSTIFVIDNGSGMTSRQLNDWAIYRLSKFNRKEKAAAKTSLDNANEAPPSPQAQCFQRFLNSKISYFGVGGKQAVFFIGNCARMITKSKSSCDVHEMCISKEGFEEKERNNKFVYDGEIINRNPGDFSHHAVEEDYICRVIAEEVGKESFTCVVMQGISQEHITFLRQNFKVWCRQLAHIYHYYIHGPNGNMKPSTVSEQSLTGKLSIEVKLFNRGLLSKSTSLSEVDDDLQTLYIRSSVSSFDFKAVVEGIGVAEGIIRYHPFLYNKETYPQDVYEPLFYDGVDDEDDMEDVRKSPNRRPLFECFWNGRLIPYTCIEDFDWCSLTHKNKSIPQECYSRISGVLWTNDVFQVSTNKLTFINLEVKLRDKNAVFCRLFNTQEKRGNIDKQFSDWLLECHETFDKQICFRNFQDVITREDLPRIRQFPWSAFGCIEWDSRIFKTGQLVRLQRVVNVQYGSIKRFLLYGDYTGDVYSTGGYVEWVQEPKCLYGDVKIHPIYKLDRQTTDEAIKKWIVDEEEKLPYKLIISWPEDEAVTPGCKIPAGHSIGALKVEIANRKGELISKLPGSSLRKLLVELKIILHSSTGDVTLVNHLCQHCKNWPYWFKKMENMKTLGSYSLKLQVVLNESGLTQFNGKDLPSCHIRFSVTEADAKKFTIGVLDGPFFVGQPFKIPLEFQDKFGNDTKPNGTYNPVLEASGLVLKYEAIEKSKGNTLQIKNIVAMGAVDSISGKNFQLSIKIPELDNVMQSLKIRVLPGPPHCLKLLPLCSNIEIENGQRLNLEVQVQDVAGNNAACPKLSIACRFISRFKNLPTYAGQCNSTGQATLIGGAIKVPSISGPEVLKAIVEVQNLKNIPLVEKNITIVPSTKAVKARLFYVDSSGKKVEVDQGKDLAYRAGDVISDLEFSLYDEAGREIKITNHMASKIKVNWVPRIKPDQLMDGKLPDIKVPISVSEVKFCDVMVGVGSHCIDFHFTVRPLPGTPRSLLCSLSSSSSVQLGEILSSDLVITPVDEHGNHIKKVSLTDLFNVSVSCDHLDVDKLVKGVGQGSVFIISGLRFSSGPLGERELCVKWNDIVGRTRLTVTAGPPSTICLPELGNGLSNTDVVSVLNGSQLTAPLVVALCDRFGNVNEECGVKVLLTCDQNLKISPAQQLCKTDKHGRANFGVLTIAVRPSITAKSCVENLCPGNCYGVFNVTPNVTVNRKTISGPTLRLHVTSDFSKPVSLSVEYNRDFKCVAGEELPEFKVCVLAEDTSVVNDVSSSKMFMYLWYGNNSLNRNLKNVITFSPSQKACDEHGNFYFKKLRAPEISGVHSIQFTYKSDSRQLDSSLIALLVVPSLPVKLASECPPVTPTVSNTAQAAHRTLIKNIRLELMDKFENKVGAGYSGTLNVKLLSNDHSELPVLVGGVHSVKFPITNGQVELQNLIIEENSPGVDENEYFLDCCASVKNLPPGHSIPSFVIPFLFYNDRAKQSQMASLTKDRDALVHAIDTFKGFFDTLQQLIAQLEAAVQKTTIEELDLRAGLQANGIPPSVLRSVANVDAVINQKSREKEAMARFPRRQCLLKGVGKDPDVLGKVAFLAEVEDDNIACILSWHMASNMDCIITHTTEKAMDIYHRMHGLQEVLALDSINKRNVQGWNKPLPHFAARTNIRPSGNPVFARNLLTFPNDPENCKQVFMLFLGDTIIFDTIEDATTYRREVVRYVNCPTLLTRNGERVHGTGKFGGRHNKAPSMDKLNGAVFGKPLPLEYSRIASQIEMLNSYKRVLERQEQEMEELKQHKVRERSREMQQQRKLLKEKEEQLEDLDRKLGMSMTPSRAGVSSVSSPRSKHQKSTISSDSGMFSASASVELSSARTPRVLNMTVPLASSSPRNLRRRTNSPFANGQSKRARN